MSDSSSGGQIPPTQLGTAGAPPPGPSGVAGHQHLYKPMPYIARGRWHRIRHGTQWARVLVWVVAVAALLAALVLTIAVLPGAMVQPEVGLAPAERLKAENDVRSGLLQAVGGVALLGGLAYTAQTFRANRSAQLADRFTKAIGQLGEPTSAVRVGALASLEGLAAESWPDYDRVTETVVSFVRDQASVDAAEACAEAQTALRMLGRRRGIERETMSLQLDRLFLRSVDLDESDLRWVNLSYSDLTGSSFVKCDLRHAVMSFARFDAGFLTLSNCRDAHFGGASMRGTYFLSADLSGAALDRAILVGADFSDRRHPDGSVRRPAPTLHRTDFTDADLTGADFCGADLTQAVGLTDEQIRSIHLDERTKLPTHVRDPRPAAP